MKNSAAVTRMTAFWALCESGLGGILHASQIPFKGGVLCLLAILSISMIVKMSNSPVCDVFKATVIVILIKAVISPHSPITAYLAVGFQGVIGAVLLGKLEKHFSIWFVSIACFLETAAQKMLILWLFFGNSFWDALDDFGHWILGLMQLEGKGWILPIVLYFGLYFLLSIISAIWIPRLQKRIFSFKPRNYH